MLLHGFILNDSEATDNIKGFKYPKWIRYAILDRIRAWMLVGETLFEKQNSKHMPELDLVPGG